MASPPGTSRSSAPVSVRHSTTSSLRMSAPIGKPSRTPRKVHRAGQGTGREHRASRRSCPRAVGKSTLIPDGGDPPLVQEREGIVEMFAAPSRAGRPGCAGPPSAVSRAKRSQAARQASWKAGLRTRSSHGCPARKSSGNITRSAPRPAACFRAARSLRLVPVNVADDRVQLRQGDLEGGPDHGSGM